jgi:predicted dehydrogenase
MNRDLARFSTTPTRALLAGLGGFAASHHAALIRHEAAGRLRLVGVCDPDPTLRARAAAEDRAAGRRVEIFEDYGAMIAASAGRAEFVVLPTPIALHAEMHRLAVEAGLAVYLEKPPTLDPAELERMIEVDRAAPRASLVGFNFMVEPARLALKTRLLAGEFGAVRGVTLRACWSRPRDYFTRNSWAGRLFTADGRPLLDSCLGNAMAHLVHNVLHWCGDEGLGSWARPVEVRARLARAHAIETADTVFVAARLHNGVPLRIALSHLGVGREEQEERVECELATLRYQIGSHHEIAWRDGRVERVALPAFDAVAENQLNYLRHLRGEVARPATTLADSRPFVALNALAYLSAGGVVELPAGRVSWTARADGRVFAEVPGVGAMLESFCSGGFWPDEWIGLGPGSAPPTAVGPGDLPGLSARLSRFTSPAAINPA